MNGLQRVAGFREIGTLALLLIVLFVAAGKEPRFLQPTSIESILQWVPMLLVVGLGQMMVIVSRGIDVSVGSMVGVAGMVVGMLFRANPGLNVELGALVGVGVGLALGSLNGLLIAGARVPPIITTLGGLSAYRGLTFILSQGKQINSNEIPDGLSKWSLEGPFRVGGVTVHWILLISLALAAIAGWFLMRSRAGRDIFALGSNPEAARLRGVPVMRTQFIVYAVTGALCGLAGVFYASRYGFVNPGTAGSGLELIVIAAVVIGGTNVTGGSGTVLGVLLGCLLLGSISTAMAVLGIEENWQQLVYGVIILVGVILDTAIRRLFSGSARGEALT